MLDIVLKATLSTELRLVFPKHRKKDVVVGFIPSCEILFAHLRPARYDPPI